MPPRPSRFSSRYRLSRSSAGAEASDDGRPVERDIHQVSPDQHHPTTAPPERQRPDHTCSSPLKITGVVGVTVPPLGSIVTITCDIVFWIRNAEYLCGSLPSSPIDT